MIANIFTCVLKDKDLYLTNIDNQISLKSTVNRHQNDKKY